MTHIFTYGSLMFEPVWSQVVRGSYQHFQGTISGYIRLRIRNENYPALVPGPLTASVSGIVYLDIDAEDLARLDAFEGSIYLRKNVQVRTGNNLFAADAYLLRDSYRHLSSDREWDPEEFEKHGIHEFLGSYFGFDR